MRNLLTACAMVAMLVAASTAQAGEPRTGDIPDAMLAEMGLGGMERVSDAEGAHIRGQGPFTALNFLNASTAFFNQVTLDPTGQAFTFNANLLADPNVMFNFAATVTAIAQNPFTF